MSCTTWAINNSHGAMTKLPYAFSRVWRVQGVYYAINQTGIYVLDVPVTPAMVVQTAHNDLGTEKLKRLPTLYVTGVGKAKVAVDYDGEAAVAQSVDFQPTGRVKLSCGAKGRLVNLTLTSSDPAFEVSGLTFEPDVLSRGVR